MKELYKQARQFLLDYHWTDKSLKKAENPMALVATMIEVFVNDYLQPVAPEADQPHKSAEEETFECFLNREYPNFWADFGSFENIGLSKELILSIIEEYASQKTEIPEMISNEYLNYWLKK